MNQRPGEATQIIDTAAASAANANMRKEAEDKDTGGGFVHVDESAAAAFDQVQDAQEKREKAAAVREARLGRGAEVMMDVAERASTNFQEARTWLGQKASGLWKSVSKRLFGALETTAVGVGAALEAKDKVVEIGQEIEQRATEIEASVYKFVGDKAHDAYRGACRIGRAFIENKYVQATGRVAKYAGIGVGVTAATPFALVASPFVGPYLSRMKPDVYEALRDGLRKEGRLGEYGAAGVSEVPGMLGDDIKRVAKNAYDGVTGWFKSKWERAGQLKDKFCDWANKKRLAMMEKMGIVTTPQMKAALEENAKLRQMLEQLIAENDTKKAQDQVPSSGDEESTGTENKEKRELFRSEKEAADELIPYLDQEEDREWILRAIGDKMPVQIKRSSGEWQQAMAKQLFPDKGLITVAWEDPSEPGHFQGKTISVKDLIDWKKQLSEKNKE